MNRLDDYTGVEYHERHIVTFQYGATVQGYGKGHGDGYGSGSGNGVGFYYKIPESRLSKLIKFKIQE